MRGIITIDSRDPNMAPIVKEPIKKPLVKGFSSSFPYMSMRVESLKTDMYTRE